MNKNDKILSESDTQSIQSTMVRSNAQFMMDLAGINFGQEKIVNQERD